MRAWMLMVARRYFATKRRDKSLASSILSVLGLALGTATLVVVLGVMNGFQLGFIDSILSVSSFHVTAKPDEPLRPADARSALDRIRAVPGVASAMPFADLEGIAGSRSAGGEKPVRLRAVPPDFRSMDPGLAAKLGKVSGEVALPAADSVIVGSELAANLGLRKGSRLRVATVSGDGSTGVQAISADFTVAGVFKTGFYDFDLYWAFISLDGFKSRFGYEPDITIGVKLDDPEGDGRFISALAAAQGVGTLEAKSWRDYNRAYFGALRTEKTMMMLVIGLVFVVVAVNIYHSLRRSVYEREEEIAVMRTMGASPGAIRSIFVSEGLIIGVIGALIGLCAGLLVSSYINEVLQAVKDASAFFAGLFQKYILGVEAPAESVAYFSSSVFYIDKVPSRPLFGETLLVALCACASAAAAAWLASRRISKIRPSEVIRYE